MTAIITGTIIDDRYEVLSQLGEGGMGTVFRAREIGLGRIVALKVLHQGLVADDDSRLRFEREGKIISDLSHSHILTFYRLGIWQNTYPYLAMEYLEGAALDSLLQKETCLSWQRVTNIVSQIADGMHYAHSKGIVHRDLKPNNIMLLCHPEPDYVKILDFGLAKLVTASNAGNQKLTQTGALVGSVFYMSPEQCTGRPVDARSDIYSLGCITYEMLCGQPPFSADNPVGMLHLHATEEARPLRQMENCRNIPASLEAVVLKCLAKDSSERYDSMADLKTDLNLVNQGRTVAISPTKRQSRNHKGSNRPVVWATALAVLGLILVLLFCDSALAAVAQNIVRLTAKPNSAVLNLDVAERLEKLGRPRTATAILEAQANINRRADPNDLALARLLTRQARLAITLGGGVGSERSICQAALGFLNYRFVKKLPYDGQEAQIIEELYPLLAQTKLTNAPSTEALHNLCTRYTNLNREDLLIRTQRALVKIGEIRFGNTDAQTLSTMALLAGSLCKKHPQEAVKLVDHIRKHVFRTGSPDEKYSCYSNILSVDLATNNYPALKKDFATISEYSINCTEPPALNHQDHIGNAARELKRLPEYQKLLSNWAEKAQSGSKFWVGIRLRAARTAGELKENSFATSILRDLLARALHHDTVEFEQALQFLASQLALEHDKAEAADIFKQILEDSQSTVFRQPAYDGLIFLARSKGDLIQALRWVDKSVAEAREYSKQPSDLQNPDNPQFILCRSLYTAGNIKEEAAKDGRADLKEAVELVNQLPENEPTVRLKALTLLSLLRADFAHNGELATAIVQINALLAAHKESLEDDELLHMETEPPLLLARRTAAEGKMDQARKLFTAAAERARASKWSRMIISEVLVYHSRAELAAGNIAEALKICQQAEMEARLTEVQDFCIDDLRAAIYRRSGQYREEHELLLKMLERYHDNALASRLDLAAETNKNAAVVEEHLGLTKQAAEHLTTFLALLKRLPGDTTAQQQRVSEQIARLEGK